MNSVFQRALGPAYDDLHPAIAERYALTSADRTRCVGRGRMYSVRHNPLALPVLWAGTRRNLLFPEQGADVPFEVRTTSATFTDADAAVLVTPLIAVAVYRGDRLHGVYPHSDGEDTYTVADAIATLRTGEVPTPLGTAPAPEPVRPDGCPDCGGDLVDGQGLLGCVDCEWTGTATENGRLVASPVAEPTEGEIIGPARR